MTFQCTQASIRTLFIESLQNYKQAAAACPETCEYLYGAKPPPLFDIHQGAFLQAILTMLFSGPYLLAYYLASSRGRLRLRSLFTVFSVVHLAFGIPIMIIANAMLFAVTPGNSLPQPGAADKLPSVPDLVVADAMVQLEVFASAIIWSTVWLRHLIETSDARHVRHSNNESDGVRSKHRLRPLRLLRGSGTTKDGRRSHRSDQALASAQSYVLVLAILATSVFATTVLGSWYLIRRLYFVSTDNLSGARDLCGGAGSVYAPLALDPSRIVAVPSGAHMLILALLFSALLIESAADRASPARRWMLSVSGCAAACAFSHGWVLSSALEMARVRGALVAVFGEHGADVDSVASPARVLAVVVWVPVVGALGWWFWGAFVLASGLCPSFITNNLSSTPQHPGTRLWRFNPKPESLADRFRLVDPDEDDNICGGGLPLHRYSAGIPEPVKARGSGEVSSSLAKSGGIITMDCQSGSSREIESVLPRSPPRTAASSASRGRGGQEASPAPGVVAMGVSCRGLPMQAPTSFI
ncbi:hypothetical protein MN608_00048 [Microdochium nivale]|nr:hypothetical protein MN608_00048 [Microdochium nivale]